MNPKVGPVPAAALISWLKDRPGGASAWRREHDITAATLSNWKARGIPMANLPRVAHSMGITVDQYLRAAGHKTTDKRVDSAAQLESFIAEYLSLPPGLQEYVRRKTSSLRLYTKALPPFLSSALHPPPDQARYEQWERDIAEDMAKRLVERKE